MIILHLVSNTFLIIVAEKFGMSLKRIHQAHCTFSIKENALGRCYLVYKMIILKYGIYWFLIGIQISGIVVLVHGCLQN